MSARTVALLTLGAVEQKDAWANGQLKKEIAKARLDRRDAALATRLCFGTLQNRILLDYYIQAFAAMKVSKMERVVRDNLRLALYQLLFMERIPPSAAVNEAVSLTRKFCKNPRAAGMVNGILRNVLRNLDSLPPIKGETVIDESELCYSHPKWLVEEFSRYLSLEEVEALLEIHNSAAPTTVQINRCRAGEEAVITALEQEGVTVMRHPWLPDCFTLSEMGNLEQLGPFQEGSIYVQDPAAKLAVLAAAPKTGDRVLDLCAAPGGKSFAAAICMGDEGALTSCDLYPHKKALIEAGALRLGLTSIRAEVSDATKSRAEWEQGFDLVIADVPCSGLGVIRKKPEIRYKNPEEMQALPQLQEIILENAASYVKSGGALLYATCTLRREENEDVVTAFLKEHGEFALEGFTLPGPISSVDEGMLTLWPQRLETDGFFIAKLRRLS